MSADADGRTVVQGSSKADTTRARARSPLVAVAGNPNTGKTTLFNRLTGSHHKVGNYPGVTVERVVGEAELASVGPVRFVDIPGTYSLSARSEEESIALAAIAGLPPHESPDAVLVVVDATQLTRNLYLTLQLIEIDVPVVVALNMTDLLRKQGHEVDHRKLSDQLGVPVVSMTALRGEGFDELRAALSRVLLDPRRGRPGWRWRPNDSVLLEDVGAVAGVLPESWYGENWQRRDAVALWALLSVDEPDQAEKIAFMPEEVRERVLLRRSMAHGNGREIDAEVIAGRYGWIDERAEHFLLPLGTQRKSATDRIDSILLHPALGFAIFLALMGFVFQLLFSGADPAIAAVESAFDSLGSLAARWIPAGIAQEFVADGLIAGVGSVLVFLPQILLLFLFIGFMEDTGYMARVAFLMDRIMRALGLHGRAFVPMLSGFACAVPAVLATRTMERRRDRLLTMMVLPLMTCSARLPVYSLVIAALFPPSQLFGFLPVQGLLMVCMYLFSTLTALAAAFVLGRTMLRGPQIPLILELPPYRVPHLPSVLRMMWRRSRMFLSEAGTVILVCTIALWGLLSFPRSSANAEEFESQRVAAEATLEGDALAERVASIEAAESSDRLRSSFGGRLGRALEPAIEPLGFDWKIGVGLIGAFAAREVFISTMGVVYGLGDDTDETSSSLRQKIHAESHADGSPVYTPLVGLSLMIFFALACQCMSTLAAVKRETGGWRWPTFLFVYMTALAWVASFAVFQGGRLLGFS